MKNMLPGTARLLNSLLGKSKPQWHYQLMLPVCFTGKSPVLYCSIKLITMHTRSIVQLIVAKYPFKNYYFLAVIIAFLFCCSCKKENFEDTALNSTTAKSTSAQAVAATGPSPNIGYGAFIRPPGGKGDNFKLTVADQLGISCLRDAIAVPSQEDGDSLVPILNTKYEVLLNFSSKGSGTLLKPFRTDLTQYKKDLNNILNTLTTMPVVAVIENEESNRYFYSGTAVQYINQLKAAISVMHARNIKTTNGAITKPGLELLVYQDFLAQGKRDSARMYKQLTKIRPNDTAIQHRADFVDTLLINYAVINMDYVNFHWKDSTTNTDALNETINYLQKRTGKTIFSNELGQFDEVPNTLLALVQLCTNRQFPYIIWYSPDESFPVPEYPLQYSDATLTPTGFAYRDYLAGK